MQKRVKGRYTELITIGIAKSQTEVCVFEEKARDWIEHEKRRRQPQLDLFGERLNECNEGRLSVEQVLSISQIFQSMAATLFLIGYLIILVLIELKMIFFASL